MFLEHRSKENKVTIFMYLLKYIQFVLLKSMLPLYQQILLADCVRCRLDIREIYRLLRV